MFEEMLRSLLGGVRPSLVLDAVRVGSALGRALRDSGCVVERSETADDGKQIIHAVSPAGMEFTITLDALGFRCACGINHDAPEGKRNGE